LKRTGSTQKGKRGRKNAFAGPTSMMGSQIQKNWVGGRQQRIFTSEGKKGQRKAKNIISSNPPPQTGHAMKFRGTLKLK